RGSGCRTPGLWHKRSLPQLHGSIEAGRGDPFAVRAERYALDPAGVAAQTLDLLDQRVPNLDGRIRTTPGKESAIGAERQAFHAAPSGIAQVVLLFPRLCIPELDGSVRAGRGQKLPVRAERDAFDETRVRS